MTIETCDGPKLVEKYVATGEEGETSTIYLGKDNGIPYQMESSGSEVINVLKSYDIKKATEYTQSEKIGTSYGTYTSSKSGRLTATYYAESDSEYCINFDVESDIMLMVNKNSGAIVGWTGEGKENITVNGSTVSADKSNVVMVDTIMDGVEFMSIKCTGYVYDELVYQLKVDSSAFGMSNTETITIVL